MRVRSLGISTVAASCRRCCALERVPIRGLVGFLPHGGPPARLGGRLSALSFRKACHPHLGVLPRSWSLSMMSIADHGHGGQSWCEHELSNTVTTDWVEDHLHDPEVALVDIRGRVDKEREEGSDYYSTVYRGLKEDYLDAHVPGAVFVDWTKDIAATDENGVPAQLTDRESFLVAMEERGVGGNKRVVVYDNGDMLFATRFWWAMRRYGNDRVSVMDGGWAKWVAEDREISLDSPCPLEVNTEWTVSIECERPELVASAADVRAALEAEGSIQLLDARAAVQFTGEVRRARQGGHIPGALNTPYRAFLTEERSGPNGSYRVFRPLDDIEQVFEGAHVDTSPTAPPVIAYCNGGVASTVPLFLLHQLGIRNGGCAEGSARGRERAWANYDGSWNEWGNDDDAPVSTSQTQR